MSPRRTIALAAVPLALGLVAAALWLSRPGGGKAPLTLEPGPGSARADSTPATGVALAPPFAPAGDPAAHGPAPKGRDARPSASAPPPAELAAGEAELSVRVLGAETGGAERPLEGVGLHLLPEDELHLEVRRVSRARARLGEAPTTDEDGRASFVVPAGRAWVLRVVPRAGRWQAASTRVRALAEGEHYEATKIVPLGGDLELSGRVLRAEDGEPIAGARLDAHVLGVQRIGGGRLARASHPRESTSTDEGGRFRLPSTSWERTVLRIQADGFAVDYVLAPEPPEEGELRPLVIRLERAATLELELRDPAGEPLAGMDARVDATAAVLAGVERTDAPSFVRAGRSDAEGRADLDELPPLVPLDLALVDSRLANGRGEVVRREPEPLVLQPGERRRLVLTVAPPEALVGRLVDQRGLPVANQPVWMLPDEGEELLVFVSYRRPVREGVSDGEGRFVLPHVPVGRWWVGPAPLPSSDPRPLVERVAPLAQLVTHQPRAGAPPTELRVVRGLGLSGSLRAPDGSPVAGVVVRAAGLDAPLAVEATSDESGGFALGPLVPGEYQLVARPNTELGLAGPPPEVVEAGRADLELVLVPAASVEGRVSGDARGVEVALVPEDPSGAVGWRRARDGEQGFRFEGLSPGRYALVASLEDGRIALERGIALVAGEARTGLVLELERGARLSVRAEGATEPWLCELSVDGLLVDFASCAAGEDAELVAPAGRVRVVVRESSTGRYVEDELELAAGRRKIVRLRPR